MKSKDPFGWSWFTGSPADKENTLDGKAAAALLSKEYLGVILNHATTDLKIIRMTTCIKSKPPKIWMDKRTMRVIEHMFSCLKKKVTKPFSN